MSFADQFKNDMLQLDALEKRADELIGEAADLDFGSQITLFQLAMVRSARQCRPNASLAETSEMLVLTTKMLVLATFLGEKKS